DALRSTRSPLAHEPHHHRPVVVVRGVPHPHGACPRTQLLAHQGSTPIRSRQGGTTCHRRRLGHRRAPPLRRRDLVLRQLRLVRLPPAHRAPVPARRRGRPHRTPVFAAWRLR